jgi:hypothetical protein
MTRGPGQRRRRRPQAVVLWLPSVTQSLPVGTKRAAQVSVALLNSMLRLFQRLDSEVAVADGRASSPADSARLPPQAWSLVTWHRKQVTQLGKSPTETTGGWDTCYVWSQPVAQGLCKSGAAVVQHRGV